MTQEEILKFIKSVDAIHNQDHFIYTSGKHGASYFNKDAIYAHPNLISKLCLEFATKFRPDKVDTVIAPAIGGIILSQWTAFHLSNILSYEVIAAYAEKSKSTFGEFVIKRDYEQYINSKNVLVLEDVITTGKSVLKVIEAVKAHGGNVVGLGTLCNRSGLTVYSFNVPKFVSLLTCDFKTWNAEDCPLCQKGIPINTKLGSPV